MQTRTSTRVTGIDAEGVTLECVGRTTRIRATTVLWAAGVQASPLGKILRDRAGATLDKAGRVQVAPNLSASAAHPEILVIGDLAALMQDGKPVPGLAPAAMQQGRYAAKLVEARLENKTLPPFHYRDKGSLATIGRNRAVADIGPLHFSGFPAWLAWLFIHLLFIVEFQNRLLIAIQWAIGYFTFNRGARLITGEWAARATWPQALPERRSPADSGTSPQNPDRTQQQTHPGS